MSLEEAQGEGGASAFYRRLGELAAQRESLPPERAFDLPCLHVMTSDRDKMLWRPKALAAEPFRERVSEDPLIGVEFARLSRRGLYVKFRLKKTHDAPLRCVVMLNGDHSFRISISRGKVGERPTHAEVLLSIDPSLTQMPGGVEVEICREAALLYYGRLVPRPQTARQWAALLALGLRDLLRWRGLAKLDLRPVRVNATRLLEESFRIKAK